MRPDRPASRRGSRDKARVAAHLDLELRERILPYWLRTQDAVRGGYVVQDEHRTLRGAARAVRARARELLRYRLRGRPVPPMKKHLVSQSRLVWSFSLAHRLGYGDEERDYLGAAECGYRFLTERLLDGRHGGFCWKADLEGTIADPRKILYGQSFALYALVEYHRASGLAESLAHARSLFEIVQTRMHDEANGGWIEHCDPDFTPLVPDLDRPTRGLVDHVGLKSCNGHLHWMEALSELLEVTGDASARSALKEVLEINATRFYPPDPGECCKYLEPDWAPVHGPLYDGFYYGHNFQFAWLMIRAQEVLGVPPGWDHFDALLRHSLRYGFDHDRGGFYTSGFDNRPATRTEKFWWVQAEGLAALSDALGHRYDAEYDASLDLLLDWILNHQVLPDGIWVRSTSAEGRILDRTKANSWKAAYHEVRGLTKFIQTFGAPADGDRARRSRPRSDPA